MYPGPTTVYQRDILLAEGFSVFDSFKQKMSTVSTTIETAHSSITSTKVLVST